MAAGSGRGVAPTVAGGGEFEGDRRGLRDVSRGGDREGKPDGIAAPVEGGLKEREMLLTEEEAKAEKPQARG